MIKASFFIDKKALFGGYPNMYEVQYLQAFGVKWFVDLTHTDEKNIFLYNYLVDNWINYPIQDGHVPENKKTFTIFLLMIKMILESLKPGEKIYLHCRGGHGRSSLVAACILCLVTQIPTEESLERVKICHNMRPALRHKWLICKSPMNAAQRKYVESYFGHLWLDSGLLPKMAQRDKSRAVVDESQDAVGDFLKRLCILNYYLHQNRVVLEIILNSGLKKLVGEGLVSVMLQTLRGVLLQAIAKKLLPTLEKVVFQE